MFHDILNMSKHVIFRRKGAADMSTEKRRTNADQEKTDKKDKLKKEIGKLKIWSADTLRVEYQRQMEALTVRASIEDRKKSSSKENAENRSSGRPTVDELAAEVDQIIIEQKDNLSELISKTDASNTELKAEDEQQHTVKSLIAKISAKITGLWAVGNEITLNCLRTYAPHPGFSQEYFREYAKAALVCGATSQKSIPIFKLSKFLEADVRYARHVDNILELLRTFDESSVRKIKQNISKDVEKLIKGQTYDLKTAHLLVFYMELLRVVLAVEENTVKLDSDQLKKEARSYLSLFLANGLYLAGPQAGDGFSYAKEALSLAVPEFRQDAFLMLALFAVRERNGKQLAYDIYLSWIHKIPVGKAKEHWPDGLSFGNDETVWRNSPSGREARAVMYNNLGYTASEIADTYELYSKERGAFQDPPSEDTETNKLPDNKRKIFQNIALENIEIAQKLKEDSYYYNWNYGLILSEMNLSEMKIIEQFDNSGKSGRNCLYFFQKALECSEEKFFMLPKHLTGTEKTSTNSKKIDWNYLYKQIERITDNALREILKQSADEILKDWIPSKQYLCEARLDELLFELLKMFKSEKNPPNWGFSEWVNQLSEKKLLNLQSDMEDYRSALIVARNNPKINEETKSDHWEAFVKLQENQGALISKPLALALLLIKQTAEHLQRFLRRDAYSTYQYMTGDEKTDAEFSKQRLPGSAIAYYTTLNTVKYLFDVMHRPNKDSAPVPVEKEKDKDKYEAGINCLTMMQTYYMNDPYEGMAFANGVGDPQKPSENILFHKGNPWQFREDIFQKNFVFLKSFTDKADDLMMWNRYGTDRDSGSRDSNGCYIQLAPEFFERVNDKESTDYNLLLDKNDDYRLYRVIYLNKDGKINLQKNDDLNESAIICYKLLLWLLNYVNNELKKKDQLKQPGQKEDPAITGIRSYVQDVLNPVIFLFKDEAYAEEKEYRLVVTRRNDEFRKIRMLPGQPEKVCINPYFQVCINQVILGPNVPEPERWFNYFRYHIAEMWRRANVPDDKIPDIAIKKSQNPYHT